MRVLFLDTVHPVLQEKLEDKGVQCHQDYTSSYTEIQAKLQDYEGLVIRSRIPVDRTLLEAGKSLQFIARSGAGLENIDLPAASELGIQVFHSAEGNRRAVAEHSIMFMLGLINHLKRGDTEVRAGQWNREKNRGLELQNACIGVIGYGYMGKELVKVLLGLGCTNILVHDKYLQNFGQAGFEAVSLERIQNEAQIISVHLPQSQETQHYVDAAFINQVKSPFYLINTARGKNVSLADLAEGIKQGKVLGAGLDVLELEKSSFEGVEKNEALDFLMQRDEVLFTPHVGGWTQESYFKLADVLFQKIEKAFL
jgi:D-3-phosphoglycerate dehydrogenase